MPIFSELVVNSRYLQNRFLSHLKRKGHDFATENIFLFEKESDILSVKKGLIHEFEFKIGVTDFQKDIRKKRHVGSRPNYFYYVVSDESIVTGEYLDYAGIYVHSFSIDGQSLFKLKKQPQMIREEKITWDELYYLLRKA